MDGRKDAEDKQIIPFEFAMKFGGVEQNSLGKLQLILPGQGGFPAESKFIEK
jgi:hypothetical protein